MQLHINHKYRSVLLVLLLLAIMSTSAQTLDWNRCFGGSYMDMPRSIIECKDGGYMLIGHSNSDDGDVLCEGFSGYDIWVTKLNKEGIIEWENKYGGHSSFDFGFDVIEHAKGYYLLSSSFSKDGQRKSRDLLGHDDIWIVNIDKEGKLKKHKTIGGSLDDFPKKIIQTKDKGYCIIGNTKSRDKDVDEFFGRQDIWVIKLRKKASVQWNTNLGSTENDECFDILQLSDGGILVAGETKASKEDPNKYDAWLVKLNSKGEKLWEKTYGGTGDDRAKCIIQNLSGEIFVAGETESTDGIFSSNKGAYDCFLMQIDENGNTEWTKTYGGSSIDFAEKMIFDEENEQFILLNGTTSSDGDINNYKGGMDIWLSFHDKDGKLTHSKTYGGKRSEEPRDLIMDKKGNLLILSETNSNDGDIETRNAYGKTDYWLMKLKPDDGDLNSRVDRMGEVLAKSYAGGAILGGVASGKKKNILLQEYDMSGYESDKQSIAGNKNDEVFGMIQATDGTGGYYLTGRSNSDEGKFKDNKGRQDCFLAKMNSNGNLSFSYNFGGKYNDVGYDIVKYDKNSFIIAGATQSNDGDIKSTHYGDDDMWIVKCNKIGEIDWERCVGGTENDIARSVMINKKKQIVATGYSQSKDNDVKRCYGNMDGMMAIVADTGKLLMVRNYGGSSNDWFNDACLTKDGGYIFVGGTKSHLEGNTYHGGTDIWVVKANAFGAIDWEITHGGISNDEAMSIIPIGRGEFIVACNSNSPIAKSKDRKTDHIRALRINNKGKVLDEKHIKQFNNIYCSDLMDMGSNSYLLGGYEDDEAGQKALWIHEFRF